MASHNSYLVPTELHDVIDGGSGHFGPVEAVTLGYQGNHLVVLILFKRHATLSENLPHQHTWKYTDDRGSIRVWSFNV